MFKLANERIDKIQNLSKQIDFNILVYIFRVKVDQKRLSVLKVH